MIPGPTEVSTQALLAMAKPVVSHRDEDFSAFFKQLTEKAKQVFQTQNDLFILAASGTGGVEAAVANLTRKGDKVVVPVFGTFSDRVAEAVKRYGGEVIRIEIPLGEGPTASLIEKTLEKHPDTKVVYIVYNETSTGVTVRELPQIAKIAHKFDAVVVADAISILGGDELPVDPWEIDVCVTGAQKCLATPPGIALVSVSDRAWRLIEREGLSTFYFDLSRYKKFFDERGQTPFTPAIPLLFALDIALTEILEEGLENRIRRHRLCAQAIYSAVEAWGMTPFAKEPFRSNTVIAVKYPPNFDDAKFRGLLKRKYRIAVAGGIGITKGMVFRIGCMGNIGPQDVVLTIAAMEAVLYEIGYLKEVGKGLAAAVRKLASL